MDWTDCNRIHGSHGSSGLQLSSSSSPSPPLLAQGPVRLLPLSITAVLHLLAVLMAPVLLLHLDLRDQPPLPSSTPHAGTRTGTLQPTLQQLQLLRQHRQQGLQSHPLIDPPRHPVGQIKDDLLMTLSRAPQRQPPAAPRLLPVLICVDRKPLRLKATLNPLLMLPPDLLTRRRSTLLHLTCEPTALRYLLALAAALAMPQHHSAHSV